MWIGPPRLLRRLLVHLSVNSTTDLPFVDPTNLAIHQTFTVKPLSVKVFVVLVAEVWDMFDYRFDFTKIQQTLLQVLLSKVSSDMKMIAFWCRTSLDGSGQGSISAVLTTVQGEYQHDLADVFKWSMYEVPDAEIYWIDLWMPTC